MKINGQKIAQKILDDLKIKVEKLKKKGIVPHLYIITLTTDSASQAYVSQKEKKGREIGVKITVENLNPDTKTEELLNKIEKLNNNKRVHGIIIQRPLSFQVDEKKVAEAINPKKDVDGFHIYSDFSPPVGLSVIKILEDVYNLEEENLNFDGWLKSKKISVIGRGVTAGGPMIKTFERIAVKPQVVTSKTENREGILLDSDIVISAVGKPNVIKKSDIKKGVILIGVGMFKEKDGKFHGDYEEDEIKDIASFYTPTPGGVGPVNVAMLLSNLIRAAETQKEEK